MPTVPPSTFARRLPDGDDPLPYPRPPWDRIEELVAGYLGATPRGGQGHPPGVDHALEEQAMQRAGFAAP